jgi:hypothetical protein
VSARWSRIQIPVRARYFSLLQKHPDQLWGPHSLLFDGFQCSFPWEISHDMKLRIHGPLVSKLRMSGAVPLLPLYAFMAWTGKLYLYLYCPDIYPDRLRKSRKSQDSWLHGPRNECGTLLFLLLLQMHWGTQWCIWLRHCTTGQKVTGLIPNYVIVIFH